MKGRGQELKAEYEKELRMSYDELCLYLQDKYGLAKSDYFATPECKSKSKKIPRTSEGLFCHHICEKSYSNLCEPHIAKISPFECQKIEKLAYCNYLEHLILHLKINVLSRSSFEWAHEIGKFFNSMGFFSICMGVNMLYKNQGSPQKWRNDCYLIIKDDFKDYIEILKATLCFVEENYYGSKHVDIKEGTNLCFEIATEIIDASEIRGRKVRYEKIPFVVVNVNALKNSAIVRYMDGTETLYDVNKLKRIFDFESNLSPNVKLMSSISAESSWDELELLLNEPHDENSKIISKWLEEGIG